MSRIRSTHPGQWTDDDFVQLSPWAQILAIAIRNFADDNGIFEWNPVKLKMWCLPAANIDVPALLAELVKHDQVRTFVAGPKTYGQIRNFSKYQRIKKPTFNYPAPSDCPSGYELNPAFDGPGGEPAPPNSRGSAEPTPARGAVSAEPKPCEPASSSEPVPHQYGKVSAEVGGMRKEEGGRTSEPTMASDDASPSQPTSSDRRTTEAEAVVSEFLRLREEGWPHDSGLTSPLMTLRTQALAWIDSGGTAKLCAEVMARVCAEKRAAGEGPPTNLGFCRKSMDTAIVRSLTDIPGFLRKGGKTAKRTRYGEALEDWARSGASGPKPKPEDYPDAGAAA